MNIIARLKSIFHRNKNSVSSSDLKDNSPEVKELSIDELYSNMTDDEISSPIIEKDEEEITSDELFIKLGMTLHNEHLYGRSLAIKEMLNNSYQILNDEYENPFKELINFTLLYFENYAKDKKEDADKLLISAFPLMHQFIYRQIFKQNNNIPVVSDFDEQKAYDEFLLFCKNVFLSLYPDKVIRDRQIKLHFVLGNDLIHFIENENTL